jgi:hypothetical protein
VRVRSNQTKLNVQPPLFTPCFVGHQRKFTCLSIADVKASKAVKSRVMMA